MNIYLGVILGLIMLYLFGYCGSVIDDSGVGFFQAFVIVRDNLMRGEFLYPVTTSSITGFVMAIAFAAVIIFFSQIYSEVNYSYMKDAVNGTGGFMSQKELKAYKKEYEDDEPYKDPVTGQVDKDASMNMIYSQSFARSINDMDTRKNNNLMVLGGAGSGKSRFLIKPNILQLNASYVVTDPSGELLTSLGGVLENHGYVIKIFNISDMQHSNQYNPLNYIRDEAGILMLIDCLISNTSGDDSAASGDNKFFVDAERLLYAACIFFLKYEQKSEKDLNFAKIFDMINESKVDESNSSAIESELDRIFNTIENKEESLAWGYYSSFKQAAGRTLKSIIISCIVRLQYFKIPQVKNLTSRDDLELDKIGDRKTALFIITPQADRTYTFLSAMLYSQLFETLYYYGEQRQQKGGSTRSVYPVRCLMDEFANTGKVPNFPGKISTMRKYNISVTIVLQDISQIQMMYKDEWKTITANCDAFLFLGSNEPETLKYIEEKLGTMTITTKSRNVGGARGGTRGFQQTKREVMTAEEIGRLPVDECIVFTGSGKGKDGIRPVRDKKYNYTHHPLYPETAEGGKGKPFKYSEIPYYDVKQTEEKVATIIEAKEQALKYGEEMEAVSMDDLSIDDINAALDLIEYPEEMQEKMFARIIESLFQTQQTNTKHPTFCVIERVEHFVPRLLEALVSKASRELDIRSLIVFIDNDDTYMCGAGIGIVGAAANAAQSFFEEKADPKQDYLVSDAETGLYSFKIRKDFYYHFKKAMSKD